MDLIALKRSTGGYLPDELNDELRICHTIESPAYESTDKPHFFIQIALEKELSQKYLDHFIQS